MTVVRRSRTRIYSVILSAARSAESKDPEDGRQADAPLPVFNQTLDDLDKIETESKQTPGHARGRFPRTEVRT
jgi:hypothetical protein